MSKAEDRYLEHFLDGRLRNCSNKDAFLYGYHQAEKDLKLSWEDISYIVKTYSKIECDKNYKWVSFSEACKETLNRFNKQKGR